MNFNITFRSLDGRRLSFAKGQVNINNNSTITNVSKDGAKMNVGFVFSCNYEPNIGVVRIEGDLSVEDTQEIIDKAMAEWDSSGQSNLPKEVAERVHNAILSNCIVEASILARDLKLPVPMPLPTVALSKQDTTINAGNVDTSYIR